MITSDYPFLLWIMLLVASTCSTSALQLEGPAARALTTSRPMFHRETNSGVWKKGYTNHGAHLKRTFREGIRKHYFAIHSSATPIDSTSSSVDTSFKVNGEAAANDAEVSSNSTLTTVETTLATTTELTKKEVPFAVLLWKFSRPHTLIGSALAIPALHILAAPSLSMVWSKAMLCSLLYAIIPSLLMNIFITGLNQITDVEIDRINKPYLPIAAGDLKPKTATIVVLCCLAISLLFGAGPLPWATEGLNVALWGSAILGTMYSLPPFRLKRFPLMAALCIVAVRGTIINAGFFAHAEVAAFGNADATALSCIANNARCMMSSLFFGFFGIVIALMKDVPDAKGDEMSNIRTFTVRIGQKRIFHTMRRLLTGLFLATGAGFARSALVAPSFWLALSRGSLCVASLWAGISARNKGLTVDAEDCQEVYDYYMYLWKLFYQSYLALPFAR